MWSLIAQPSIVITMMHKRVCWSRHLEISTMVYFMWR
jgi:hypothetical protein